MLNTDYRFKANGSNYYQVLYDGAAINWKNYAGGASYTTRMSLTNGGNFGYTGLLMVPSYIPYICRRRKRIC